MENYPRSLVELESCFSTERECHQYLFQIRWPNGFKCPQCGAGSHWVSDRGLYVCSQCEQQVSVTAGTIFHGSRKPLRLWFRAIWQITSQKYGANALGLMRVLGLGSYHTAWEWLHKLRRAMVRPERERLTGIVEVDETYIGGKRSGKRGRGAAGKVLAAIAVEDTAVEPGGKGIGRVRVCRIADASGDSLLKFIRENVEKGSTVRTDCWTGYSEVEAAGYTHEKVPGYGTIGEDLLPLVHLVASLVKRWLLGTYQGAVKPQYLDYYLDEYTFRFNRRKSASRGKLFYRLIEQAVAVPPISASRTIDKGKSLEHSL